MEGKGKGKKREFDRKSGTGRGKEISNKGGTKIMCAVGTKEGEIVNLVQIPTTTPDISIPKVIDFFKQYPIRALGVASFGPIDINPKSPNYGKILTKVKKNWQDFGLIDALKVLKVPMKLDTDVNGSCIGEMTFGTAKGLKNVVYITIGTGIGIGLASEGSMVHGIMHPEGGHICIPKNPNDKGESVCPYHSNCFEGLASGPSLFKRYGLSHAEMAERPEIWELEAEYIAIAVCHYIYVACPQKIIIGGGVMKGVKDKEHFFNMIRERVKKYDNGYYNCPAMQHLNELIVPESLEGKQGILGGLVLGAEALRERQTEDE